MLTSFFSKASRVPTWAHRVIMLGVVMLFGFTLWRLKDGYLQVNAQ